MIQTLEFDCRTICNGKRCPYLHPTNDLRISHLIKMYICRDKEHVIMAEINNPGRSNEQITSIAPINTCRQMKHLQRQGKAQWVDFSISPDGTGTYWNNPTIEK
jgi:hypothetical protein